ncbi:MAG: RNA-binding S4 domain-containing protein [Miltoncostaeaceae bacterium]
MAEETVRIDRWLWAARMFKTRSIAADAVRGGKVHVNGTRAKPSKEVRPGDEVRVTQGQISRTLIVRQVSERRGPATEAVHLYEETRESIEQRELRTAELRVARAAGQDLGRRPTKRERRQIDAARGRRRR